MTGSNSLKYQQDVCCCYSWKVGSLNNSGILGFWSLNETVIIVEHFLDFGHMMIV